MNKKGSMELSVNSIVILVIAIVMLGLILGFVRTKFSAVDKQLSIAEPDAPTASPSDQLTVSREIITASSGETIVLKVQAYSAVTTPGPIAPTIDCAGTSSGAIENAFSVTADAQSKTIEASTVQKYIMTLKLPSAAKGKYLCNLK